MSLEAGGRPLLLSFSLQSFGLSLHKDKCCHHCNRMKLMIKKLMKLLSFFLFRCYQLGSHCTKTSAVTIAIA